MNAKRIKSLKICTVIFLVIGVIFLISSIFCHSYINNFVKNGKETTATIVSITTTGSGEDITHHVEVEYFVNGIKYVNELGYYHGGMNENQVVPIIYLPDDPNKIIYGKNEFLPFWIFFGVGSAFAILGVVLLFIIIKGKKQLEYADKNDATIKKTIPKPAAKNFILLSLPAIGAFYAGFRMLFLISEHFDSAWSFFGKKFWKFWLSCALIMLASALICVPLFVGFYFITIINNTILTAASALIIFIAWGYGVFFLTNFVLRKTKPAEKNA